MRLLIATASRHGATHELGRWLGSAIADRLHPAGTSVIVDVRHAEEVDSIAEYDAVVLGSAVYLGRWLRAARSLVAREQSELETRPVWLFSSGPIGAKSGTASPGKRDTASWAIEHRVFGGKLDRSGLSWFERQVVRLIRARDGDDRSRAEIAAWSESICAVLSAPASTLEKSS